MSKKATVIELGLRVKKILEKILRQAKCPKFLVQRIKIILMASDKLSNCEIAKKIDMYRCSVGRWRNRWAENSKKLKEAEEKNINDKDLTDIITTILSDNYRSGSPVKFSPEHIIKIAQIALKNPSECGLPITHWSQAAIAKEVVKRNIVEEISQRSVGRFLKMRQI